MTAPTLLTVILNYKTAPMTLRAAAAALKAMEGIFGEIILVDNDSQDGSFQMMSEHVIAQGWERNNRVRVLQSGRNGGFGAGNNVGIRSGLSDGSRPDYIYVLNSDAFPAADAVHLLLEWLESHPNTGFVGSYIHGVDGEPHLTTFRFPSIMSEFEGAIRFGPISRLLANRTVRIPIPEESRTVDWLAGASQMMRQEVLDEIGLFDETFFLYFEETDLCRRARRAGYQTAFVRDSAVAHVGSASTGMKAWVRVPDYWFDSRWHYFTKNHGRLYAATATLAHLAGGSLNWLRCVVMRKQHKSSPHFLRMLAWHDLSALFRPTKASRQADSQSHPMTGE